jgi:DNA-binding beta-propeller fold protein YncE
VGELEANIEGDRESSRAGAVTRRAALRALGGSVFAAGLSCNRNRGTGFPGKLWVATERDRAVSVVDLETFRLVKKVNLGAEPTAVFAKTAAPMADAPVVVVTSANGTLHLIDAFSYSKRASFRVAEDILTARVLPNGKTAVVASRGSRELLFVDLQSGKVTSRQRLPGTPTHMDLSGPESVEKNVAVSLGDQGILEQVSLETGRTVRRRVSSSIGTVRYRKDGRLLFAANYEGRSVVVLDGATLEVVVELPLALKPDHFCFNADQGQLFVAGAGMDAVAVLFTYQPLIVEQTVLAGRSPTAMACSETPPYLFLSNQGGTEINIMSVVTRRVIAAVQAGLGARQILITPDNQYALVINSESGDIAVIRIPPIKGNRNRSGAALFTMIPVGDQPVSGAIALQT